MTDLNLENLKQRLPLFGALLATVLLLASLWFLINYIILSLTPKVPGPSINSTLSQDLIAAGVSVDSTVSTFANFKKVILYKQSSDQKIDATNLASTLGFSSKAIKKDNVLTWTKGEESLKINSKSLYLEYTFDTTKNRAFYDTGSKPNLEKAKSDFKKLLSQLKLNSSFINIEKPFITYSQGLQGVSESNPRPVVIPPNQATTISLTYQFNFTGRPLFGDYPEVINATAQYSLNNRLIYLKLPLLQGTWEEGSSYAPLSADELLGAIKKKDATLVSYNYTSAKIGRTKDPLKVIRVKKITAGFLLSTSYLFPAYLIEADGFTESGFAANAVFYLPAISARFFQQ